MRKSAALRGIGAIAEEERSLLGRQDRTLRMLRDVEKTFAAMPSR